MQFPSDLLKMSSKVATFIPEDGQNAFENLFLIVSFKLEMIHLPQKITAWGPNEAPKKIELDFEKSETGLTNHKLKGKEALL